MKQQLITRICLASLVLAMLALSALIPQPEKVTAQSEEYVFLRSWGGEGNIIIRPSGIALSPDEKKILIAGNSRVIILDRSDRTYKVFGGFGTKDGQLMSTNSIAVDSSGNIFVTDGYLNRIQKFSPEGNFIKKWGGIGTDIGQFNEPRGIIVDHDGYVYVSDTRNHRIQKFSNDGTYITQWVSDALINLSIDQENNIYAVGNNDVYKYSSDGLFLLKLSDIISGGGILRNPIAISISLSGDIFVLEAYGTEKCIQKIYSDGTFITKWCWTLGESIGPGQIVTDSSSNVFVADIGNNRVLKYSSDGKLIVEYGANSSSSDTFFNPKGIAVYNDRNVYVADYENDRILVFSTAGTLLNEWGSKGTGEGQFYNPNGISFDQNGFLFVADSGNARIEKFTDQGAFISQWGSQGSGDGEFSNPVGIGVNTAGEIFISDSGNSRIQKFSNNGIFQLKWTTENPSKGNIVDGNGNILSISAPYRITKYSQDGTILTTLGTQENPTSITGDQNDNYYVGQQGLSRTFITKYSNSGEQLTELGKMGSNLGEFTFIGGLASDSSESLYVSDSNNYRVQVFGTSLSDPDPDSGLVQNGSFEQDLLSGFWNAWGLLRITQSNHAYLGDYSMMLGNSVDQIKQGQGEARLHQTIFVDPNWSRPVLSFKYNMFVNDIMDYSDFFVEIQDGVGLNHLATVVRDGYQPCTPGTAPAAGTDLGWRTKTYDLSAYKGQYIRIVFSNRNLWPESWGIWTYVDDVRVIDAGPLPIPTGSAGIYLPLVTSGRCDPIPTIGISATTQNRNQP